MRKIHPKVEEAVDTLDLNPVTRRRLIAGGGLFSASLAASALLTACQSQEEASSAYGNFPKTPKWKFTFVCHVTAHPFFVPTQYGAQDAVALLGAEFQWAGSKDSIVGEMVNAVSAAVSAKANGIALAVIDARAFTAPVNAALDAGIPVVSYNADGEPNNPGTNRLAYIGQPLYESGRSLAEQLITTGFKGGDVACFIATPGALNIQPRSDGARDVLRESRIPHNFAQVATGTDLPAELNAIEAYLQGHPNVKALLAVDGGSTDALGKTVAKLKLKEKGVLAGGFDLQPGTLESVKGGSLDYTIDQQPYLQGFLPVMALYLYLLSGGLVSPADTNTSLSFVTKDNVEQFTNVKTRFEGSDSGQKLVPRSGPIPHQ
ncbi:MAG TPA: substrate-binding domain-containing protein [Pilimelia sp.]|nr:substrate-binding domain-containing protein [Pilimelia sp.]